MKFLDVSSVNAFVPVKGLEIKINMQKAMASKKISKIKINKFFNIQSILCAAPKTQLEYD